MSDPKSDPANAVSVQRLPDHVALVTINRPEARNAISPEVARGLEAAIDSTDADDDVWVVILTGAGADAFSAGADLKARVGRPRATSCAPTAAASPASCTQCAASPGSPRSTARRWPAAARSCWPATWWWRCRRRASVCPRSSAG